MDWTDFDADNQSTIALHLVTRHGRATPLLWLTVDKDELKNQRNNFEDLCLSRLKALLPEGVAVTILADRGFGDVKLFEFLESLGFQYVIRFRGNIQVSAADGETRLAVDWVGKGGRARKLHDAEITAARHKVGAVVCVKAAGMKEPWHLAASDGSLAAPEIIKLYSKRWTIEPSFRDSKDLRFGMGMSALRIDDPQRRDRLLLLNAFAILLLTILGMAARKRRPRRQRPLLRARLVEAPVSSTNAMYKLLQILWLSARYRMIGFRSKNCQTLTSSGLLFMSSSTTNRRLSHGREKVSFDFIQRFRRQTRKSYLSVEELG